MNAGRKPVAALAILSAAGLMAGCSDARDYMSDAMRPTPHYDQPVRNEASRAEPFVTRMRTPVPDRAWTRESSSEVEPWTAPPASR